MFHQVLRKATLAATLVLGMAGVAQAAPVNCSTANPNVTNLVTANIGCQLLITPDNDSDAAVSGLFGEMNWTQIDKVDPPPGTDGALTLVGDATLGGKLKGTWSISASVFSAWDSVMLVFKGADGALPDAVVAYLVDTTSGNYSSPFFDIQGGNGPNAGQFKVKDISHVSLYVANPSVIPLPAGLPLLALGLGALALVRRRKA